LGITWVGNCWFFRMCAAYLGIFLWYKLSSNCKYTLFSWENEGSDE
jgi:hypothetical protein